MGDKLIGATLNISGALVMRSERVGSGTVLSQIVQMVAQAEALRVEGASVMHLAVDGQFRAPAMWA